MSQTLHEMNNTFFIITGGPGAGKTTLLEALRQRGYVCIDEVARAIIREQNEKGGDAVPWGNSTAYTDLMLQRTIDTYNEALERYAGQPVFFDRGLPDTLAYMFLTGQTVDPAVQAAAEKYRYNSRVFLLPPWQEIYNTDEERKQSWDEAVKTARVIRNTYRHFGYDPVDVPRCSVADRVKFVLAVVV
ncbi:AAA family ATPase [Nostoc ellipsosporum NOK]|nr:AAA family ATPase [Nostoc ellipsosporum NOK]